MAELSNKQAKAKQLIDNNKTLGQLLLETTVHSKQVKEPLEVFGKKCFMLYPTVENVYKYLASDDPNLSNDEKLIQHLYILQTMLVNPDDTPVFEVGDVKALAQSRSSIILELIEYMITLIVAFYTYQLETPDYRPKSTGAEGVSVLKNYQALRNLGME